MLGAKIIYGIYHTNITTQLLLKSVFLNFFIATHRKGRVLAGYARTPPVLGGAADGEKDTRSRRKLQRRRTCRPRKLRWRGGAKAPDESASVRKLASDKVR